MSQRIPGGYILLSRKMIESAIWEKPPLYLKVWIYLLSRAQHADYKALKRGQLRTSIPEIIEACSWKSGYRTEKPTKDQIFQILEWLRSEDGGGHGSNDGGNDNTPMITTTRATHALLVNIENYCFYQDVKNYGSNKESNNEMDTEATTGGMREQRQPDNINKNVLKNDKNDVKDIVPFSEIIEHLNHKTGQSYKPTTKKTQEHIRARWKEGFQLQDFITVIDKQTVNWLYDPKMVQYLRPETLFGTKFESYLNTPVKVAQPQQTTPKSENPLIPNIQAYSEQMPSNVERALERMKKRAT